jgi:hypothetical protein
VISAEVAQLIRTCIRSIWELELLLLAQRDPARRWTVEGLVRELRSSPRIVGDAVAALGTAGLLAAEDGYYRYQPATPELDRLVRELRAAHAGSPVAVAETIYAAPNRQIRDFADAFRLKKD